MDPDPILGKSNEKRLLALLGRSLGASRPMFEEPPIGQYGVRDGIQLLGAPHRHPGLVVTGGEREVVCPGVIHPPLSRGELDRALQVAFRFREPPLP